MFGGQTTRKGGEEQGSYLFQDKDQDPEVNKMDKLSSESCSFFLLFVIVALNLKSLIGLLLKHLVIQLEPVWTQM